MKIRALRRREEVALRQWQIRAVLESGAIVVFGLQARDVQDARGQALGQLSRPPRELEVSELPRVLRLPSAPGG